MQARSQFVSRLTGIFDCGSTHTLGSNSVEGGSKLVSIKLSGEATKHELIHCRFVLVSFQHVVSMLVQCYLYYCLN